MLEVSKRRCNARKVSFLSRSEMMKEWLKIWRYGGSHMVKVVTCWKSEVETQAAEAVNAEAFVFGTDSWPIADMWRKTDIGGGWKVVWLDSFHFVSVCLCAILYHSHPHPSASCCLGWSLLQIRPAGDRTCTRLLAFLRMRADFEAQQNDGIVWSLTSKELYPSSWHSATFAIFPRWLTLMSTMLLMRWTPGRPARLHTVAKPSHPWCRQRRRNSKFAFFQISIYYLHVCILYVYIYIYTRYIYTFSISDSFLIASKRWLSQIVQKDLCQQSDLVPKLETQEKLCYISSVALLSELFCFLWSWPICGA